MPLKKALKYLIISKPTHVLLELHTFKASKMEQFSTALFNGQFCGTRLPTTGPICALAFLLSTWACWKQTVDFQRMSIANKLVLSG